MAVGLSPGKGGTAEVTSQFVKLFKALNYKKIANGAASLLCCNASTLLKDQNLYRQGKKSLLCLVTRELNFSTAAQSYWKLPDGVIASPPQSPTET